MKVSIDTRTLQPGDVFIPIKGKNFDGHDFIEEAKRKGASRILDVDLGKFAKQYRQKFKIPVVAITGSVGKTTTKDMTASILGQKFKVLKNEENLNNEIGVPLTVLKIEKDTQIAVLELAMRGLNQIKYLAEIVQPSVGIITNIGLSHVELLKNRQNIAKAKSELIEVLGKKFNPLKNLKEPVIILNRDDNFYKFFEKKAKFYKVKVISFGINSKADFTADDILLDSKEVSFILKTPQGKIKIKLPQPGEHNVYNALASASCGFLLGVSLSQIKSGLEDFLPSSKRMEIIETSKVRILNDTYNASPDSMKAAIKILKEQKNFLKKVEPRKVAILGDMLELGNFSASAHRQIGEFLVENGCHVLLLVGENAFYIGQGAINLGMSEKNIYFFENNQALIKALKNIIKKGDVVLVKGSRGMKMEEIVESLKFMK